GDLGAGGTLGGDELVFRSGAGTRLPAALEVVNGARTAVVATADLEDGALEVTRLDRSGAVDTQTLTVTPGELTQLDDARPSTSDTLTRGALTPLAAVPSATARIATLDHTAAGASAPYALTAPGEAFAWASVPEEGAVASLDYAVQVSGSDVRTESVPLVDNQPELDQVTVASPRANQTFVEGDEISIRFLATESEAGSFRFAEVRLLNVDGVLQAALLVDERNADLTLRLPLLPARSRENFLLNVRAYYGDTLRFAERTVGLQVNPTLVVGAPALEGLGGQIFAGSLAEFTALHAVPPGGSSRIAVFDSDGALVAAGALFVRFTVPDFDPAGDNTLTIVTSVENGFGEREETTRTIAIVDPFRLVPAAPRAFDAALADVGDTWVGNGRVLEDRAGTALVTLDSEITALAHMGDRLAVGLRALGIQVLDPANGFEVLSELRLAGEVEDFVVADDRALAIVDGGVVGFTVAGNAIENAAPVAGLRGRALQVQAEGENFVVLTERQIARVGADFSLLAESAGRFTALAQRADALFAVRSDGRVRVLDAQFAATDLGMGVRAERLVPYAGYLLALSSADAVVTVLDARVPSQTSLVGRFPVDLGADTSAAVVSGGQLWVGGAAGARFDLVPGASPARIRYRTQGLKGEVASVAAGGGRFVGGGGAYGAVLLDVDAAGRVDERAYPAPFSVATTDVGVAGSFRYLLQPDFQRVLRLAPDDTAEPVLEGQPFQRLAVGDQWVAAAAGSQLYLTRADDLGAQGQVEVATGVDVVAMVSLGDTVYVSDSSRTVQAIQPGPLPVQSHLIRRRVLVNAPSAPIDLLAATGDHLFYADADMLHRLDLGTGEDLVVDVSDTEVISALHVARGRVFVGLGSSVRVLRADTLALDPDFVLTGDSRVEAIATDHNHLFVGQGGDGVWFAELPPDLLGASPALASPAVDQIFVQGEKLMLSLRETQGLVAARVFVDTERVIDGSTVELREQVGVRTEAPFALEVLVPPTLRNGNPFEIVVEGETETGAIATARPRRVFLQGENLPENPFSVRLEVTERFLPNPLELRAFVDDSTQPVAQVEFYFATAADGVDGPYELIGKNVGPEFFLNRNFPLEESGGFLKARAIDVYGNFKESDPQVFERLEDFAQPNAAIAAAGDTIGGQFAAGHPIEIQVDVTDAESGVQIARLTRNGVLVAAGFDDGVFVFQEPPPEAGEVLTYAVDVIDRAGNPGSASQTYTIVADMPPQLGSATVPAQIRERSRFSTTFQVTDDLELSELRLTYRGSTQVRRYSDGRASSQETFNWRDARSERLTALETETLVLEMVDDLGQTTSESFSLNVGPDAPPNASNLVVALDSAGFFGRNVRLGLEGLQNVDDGPVSDLRFEVVDVSGTPGEVVRTASPRRDDQTSLDAGFRARRAPVAPGNDTMQVRIRVIDGIGQVAETAALPVLLTQVPNEIRFFRGDQDALNAPQAKVGTAVPLQVLVADAAGRPVSLQTVRWFLRQRGTSSFAAVGETQTGTDGTANLDLATVRAAGAYELSAYLDGYCVLPPRAPVGCSVAPALASLELVPGDLAQVQVGFVPSVEVEQVFGLSLQALDAFGNAIPTTPLDRLEIQIDQPNVHFGFASDVEVEDLVSGGQSVGERARVRLENGRANLSVAAGTQIGLYDIDFRREDGGAVAVLYDDDNSGDGYVSVAAVPLNVLPGAPATLRYAELAQTNHPFGRPDVLENEEVATVQLAVFDRFGNAVETRLSDPGDPASPREDLNLTLVLALTGMAQGSEGILGTTSVDLVRGVGSFDVTTPEVELVVVDAEEAVALLGVGADTTTTSLAFGKRPPHVFETELLLAEGEPVNPLVVRFSEPVTLPADGTVAVAVASDGGDPVTGVFLPPEPVATGTELTFQPDAPLALGTCYDVDTRPSELRGVAADDVVLAQLARFCTPLVALDPLPQAFALEGEALPFALAFAGFVDPTALPPGQVRVTPSPDGTGAVVDAAQAFPLDWLAPELQVPVHTGTDFEDGSVVSVTVSGLDAFAAGIEYPLPTADDAAVLDPVFQSLAVANTRSLGVLQRDGDFDNDRLTNAQDVALGYDPTLRDSDGNGIPDGFEDLDGDSLSNRDEFRNGTLADNPDT
ncbi:MAG: hypothetical protein MJE66_13620, partial [Proteobacteria bacterium]|nr:hypothetical protein [Pseudomonadota bacterium]